MYMQTNIVADCHSKTRGYHGADLDLPAGPYEIEDALQRAHVPEGGGYVLEGAGCWPVFLWAALWGSGPLSGGNALGELNLLADAIGSMDREQVAVYEGAVQLELKEKGKKTATLKELINLAFCLDDYTFYPGVVSDRSLGKACMKGTMRERPDLLDDMAGLTSPLKAGKMIRHRDQGVFTDDGYVYHSSHVCREFYDGEHLPGCGKTHSGLLSLLIKKMDAQAADKGVWLELPADGKVLRQALSSIGEKSFDACRITEIKGIVPKFRYLRAKGKDVEKLNMLAGLLQKLSLELPDKLMLVKYKAVLELEKCPSLDMALYIAANLDCYSFAPDYLSPGAFGEYRLQESGVNIDDPAFAYFDFKGYGERELLKCGLVITPYGGVLPKSREPVHEYAGPGLSM